MKKEVPSHLPENVQHLARLFVDGMNLPAAHKQRVPKTLSFNRFAVHEPNRSEIILADICDDFPSLACLILVRDTIERLLKSLAIDAGTADGPEIYSLMPFLEHTKNYLFGLAKLCVAKFPACYPTSFRVQDGHLVLIGEAPGEEAVRNQIGAELMVCNAMREGHYQVVKMSPLEEFEERGGPEHLRDFTVKSKTVH